MPDLSFQRLSESEYPIWDSFVVSSPQGTIFNTSRWASIIKHVFGIQHEVYLVHDGSEIAAGISFFHKRRAGLRVVTRLPLTPYNGILFRAVQGEKPQKVSSHQFEALSLLLAKFEREFQFVHFALHPSLTDLRPFTWRHWYTLPQYTYVNVLTDLSCTWENFSSSLRRKINRAEEIGFSIHQKDDASLLLKLQDSSYEKARMKPVLPYSVFQRYCEAAVKARLLRVYSIADRQGNVHAERAVIVDGDHAYDWIAGTNPQLEDEHANQLLVWEIFKRLSAEGVQRFDFLGANTPSIVEFKRAFGGELQCYFEVRYFSSTFVQTLVFLHQRWQRWRRRA